MWPGTSEFNQLCKIVESLGLPPRELLDQARWTSKFFNRHVGTGAYELKSAAEFEEENATELPKERRYFKYTRIADLVEHYPLKKGISSEEAKKERDLRNKYAHFLQVPSRPPPAPLLPHSWCARAAPALPMRCRLALASPPLA